MGMKHWYLDSPTLFALYLNNLVDEVKQAGISDFTESVILCYYLSLMQDINRKSLLFEKRDLTRQIQFGSKL